MAGKVAISSVGVCRCCSTPFVGSSKLICGGSDGRPQHIAATLLSYSLSSPLGTTWAGLGNVTDKQLSYSRLKTNVLGMQSKLRGKGRMHWLRP